MTSKSIFSTFLDVLKYSNYKVLSCYNLVFKFETLYQNGGSILTIIYFLGYLATFIIFLYKKLNYLKTEISKLFTKTKKRHDIRNKRPLQNNFKTELLIFNRRSMINTHLISNKKKRKSKKDSIVIKNIESKSVREEKSKNSSKSNLGENPPKKKVQFAINLDENKDIKKDKSIKIYTEYNKKDGSNELLTNKMSVIDSQQTIKAINAKLDEIQDKDKETKEKNDEPLSDYELNNLEYLIALELDNRKYLKIYWSLLKREHKILFTFFSWNDFNIFIIKLSKLFFLICTDMAFNVFFFSDDSMHNIYESGGDFDFFGQVTQMIYSTIISQVLEIFLNYLTMTDIHYYEIKEKKKEIVDNNMILSVINCIKYKIIAFYVFTFLLFFFYWYTVSSFCAVYQNTQKIFITDSVSSFLLGLVYPFILYLIPAGLRMLSLKAKEKKNLKFFYWLSEVIPFF